LVVAAVLTVRTDAPARAAFPSWVPGELGGLTIRPGAVGDLSFEREAAIDVVRQAVFLGVGPESEPLSFPTLVTGRVPLYPIAPSPSGQVVVPRVEDVPAWLVVWRGLEGETLDERFGAWPDGALVDAVFLVDGVTGDCCWFTRFLSSESSLG
jgi:hypothetical protein